MRIFINPGHAPNPNDDPGAVNRRLGLKESSVARRIGERAATYLANVGYDVQLFQYDGLGRICDAANDWDADVFVSIHCNAATGSARGTETYHAPYSAKGWLLADAIHKQIVGSIDAGYRWWDRGVKSVGFYVLSNTEMPAVLVETAFIDNDDDARLLVEHEDDFARAIARGISDYAVAL